MSTEPTVFVVDDDPALRDSLGWLLGTLKADVRAFGSAEAFLATFDPSASGCLLLDVCMPGIDGLQLLRMLAERGARLPAVVVTAHADPSNVARAMAAGARRVFGKPFDDDALLACVRECLAAPGPQQP